MQSSGTVLSHSMHGSPQCSNFSSELHKVCAKPVMPPCEWHTSAGILPLCAIPEILCTFRHTYCTSRRIDGWLIVQTMHTLLGSAEANVLSRSA
jgi:hypothetical protein